MDIAVFIHNLKLSFGREHIDDVTNSYEFISVCNTSDPDTISNFLVKSTTIKDVELIKNIYLRSKKETVLVDESLKSLP